MEDDDVEEPGLNEKANAINDTQEDISLICRYEDFIKV